MKHITFGSVCSGIEAASVAWKPLGFIPLWLSEIEAFPSAVLAHHYPMVPNLGDMTTIADKVLSGEVHAPTILTGGTPCQSFSVAGMRQGMIDPRGQLTIKFVELANAIDTVRTNHGKQECVVIWENVPGVLSDKGNAFGCFLGALAGESSELQPPGGKWKNAGCVFGPQRTIAWRTLDAQYFGLAQRRRRVFLVASARDGFDPAEILFEHEGVRRDTAPRRETGQDVAAGTLRSTNGGSDVDHARAGHLQPVGFRMAAFGEYSDDGSASTMKARDYKDATDLVVHAPISVHGTQDPDICIDHSHPLGRNSGQENAVLSVALRGREGGVIAELDDDVAGCLRASGGGGDKPHVLTHCRELAGTITSNYGKQVDNSDTALGPNVVASTSAIRRLLPSECEKLQGFEPGYTDVPYRNKPAADGPRYKAIGNSWAVPCARWVGTRVKNALLGMPNS